MQVAVSFRHMDPSNSIQQYASDKLQHVVGKYVTGADVDSHVVFSLEKFQHVANFTLSINGLTVKAVEKTGDMYSSIDLALDRVERQVRKYKDRIRDHKPARGRSFTMEIVSVPSPEEGEGEAAPAAETHEVIASEVMMAPMMTPAQAVMQMDLRHAAFFVFTHDKSERINIVYRRDDGNVGLIDPEPTHA